MQVMNTIPCCTCGVQITPNEANMCIACMRQQYDLNHNIQTSNALNLCKTCGRLAAPFNQRYENVELESPQLLSMCLKSINGLKKSNKNGLVLLDARFIYTEPHSRRVKVKLVLEKEFPELNGVKIKQDVEVEFVVNHKMCSDCQKENTDQVWNTIVQVRQNAVHKKTLLRFESDLGKDPILASILNIEQKKNGLDFYFANRHSAQKLVEKLNSSTPVLKKTESKKLTGTDVKSNIVRYKYTILLTVSPVCRFDLVFLPKKTKNRGNFALGLVDAVASSVKIINPKNGDQISLNSSDLVNVETLFTVKDTTSFMVLDGTETGILEVARESDLGVNDTRFFVKSHLQGKVEEGTTLLGYDLTDVNFSSEILHNMKKESLPDIVLLKRK
eukprot:augustus_masked-scaffold_2-processed-gene-1.12-mRNA-1 protein AED:0.05 eAED:0.05 QI:0/-1/0/1/-1/1/1/0/386